MYAPTRSCTHRRCGRVTSDALARGKAGALHARPPSMGECSHTPGRLASERTAPWRMPPLSHQRARPRSHIDARRLSDAWLPSLVSEYAPRRRAADPLPASPMCGRNAGWVSPTNHVDGGEAAACSPAAVGNSNRAAAPHLVTQLRIESGGLKADAPDPADIVAVGVSRPMLSRISAHDPAVVSMHAGP